MNKLGLISILITLSLTACNKNKNTPAPQPDPVTPVVNNSPFTCKDLPPTPAPFGWTDTTANVDHNINTFLFNPANPDEVIIVVNGDIFGYNKMYCYNIRSNKTLYLATLGGFIPSVNKNGWVVYSTVDNNIHKVKCNGDSAVQLTFLNTTKDPKWDYTGKNIFYYQAPFGSVPSQLIQITAKGGALSNMHVDMANTAVFSKSNKLIYQKVKDNTVTLVMHDVVNLKETTLINGPYSPGYVHFDDLCLDNNDEYFYWSNSAGIFRCSIATLKTDTVLKNCPNLEFMNPVFQQNRPTELLLCCHFLKPLLPLDLLHEYKPVEMNLITKEKTIVNIYAD